MIVCVGVLSMVNLCLTRDSPRFDHDEFECIEHRKFLHLTIPLDEFDYHTVDKNWRRKFFKQPGPQCVDQD